LHLVVMLAGVQGVEVRDTKDDSLAINHEPLLADLARGVYLIAPARRVRPWPASGPRCQSPR
jgi:hypothetical protein